MIVPDFGPDPISIYLFREDRVVDLGNTDKLSLSFKNIKRE